MLLLATWHSISRLKRQSGTLLGYSLRATAVSVSFVLANQSCYNYADSEIYCSCYDFYTVVKELARMQGDLSGNRDRNYDKDQLDGQTFKWPHPQEEPFTDTDISNYEGGGEGPPAPLPPPLPILKPPPPPKGPPPRKAPTPSHQLVKSITPYTLSDPVDKKWEDSNHDVSTGTVKVEKWLTRIQDNDQDLIAIMESKLRHGQFGRLGKLSYHNPRNAANAFYRKQNGVHSWHKTPGSNLRILRPSWGQRR